MSSKRNEISYYPEIQRYIETQLISNFKYSSNQDLHVFWGIGELRSNLLKIISSNWEICRNAFDFANMLPPLNLDIFGLITDGENYDLLILEVKLLKSAGLKEWSQLVGYCLVSKAKYGFLINIDGTASSRLSDILNSDSSISKIVTIESNNEIVHKLGFLEWDSVTQDFAYTNLGYLRSLSKLSDDVFEEFSH